MISSRDKSPREKSFQKNFVDGSAALVPSIAPRMSRKKNSAFSWSFTAMETWSIREIMVFYPFSLPNKYFNHWESNSQEIDGFDFLPGNHFCINNFHSSLLTRLVRMPIFSISMLMVSPAWRYRGGRRVKPTPSGVPVRITVLGSNVMERLKSLMAA